MTRDSNVGPRYYLGINFKLTFTQNIFFKFKKSFRFGRAKDEESQSLIEAAIDNLKSQIIEQNSQSNNFESSISAEINLKDLEHSNPKFRKQCLVQVINHDMKEAYDGVLDMLVNEEEVQVLDLAISTINNSRAKDF